MSVDTSAASTIGGAIGVALAAATMYVSHLLGVLHIGRKRPIAQAPDPAGYLTVIEELSRHAEKTGLDLRQAQVEITDLQIRNAVLISENRGLQTQIAELRAQIERGGSGR